MPDDINVLCVGRLAREKRYDLVIHALATSRAADRFRVTFVGTGPMRVALQKRCQILGLNSIFVTPTDAELAELYAGADLFLHAGESELEGMSVMQAMAAGVPVVVSDSADSAASTLLTHQMARFRYPDARHFANQIDRLCGPGGPVEVLSAAGHSAAKSLRFDDSVSQLVQIYRDMVFVEDKSKESDRALA
jgi:glycosyltransferase involved in cell wall biosynthesis